MWEWILNLLSRPPAICRHTRHIATILQSLPTLLGMAELLGFYMLTPVFRFFLTFSVYHLISFHVSHCFRTTLLLVFVINIVIVRDKTFVFCFYFYEFFFFLQSRSSHGSRLFEIGFRIFRSNCSFFVAPT